MGKKKNVETKYLVNAYDPEIEKAVKKCDALLERTRDEVFKYKKKIKEKTVNMYYAILPSSLVLNALITLVILKLAGR